MNYKLKIFLLVLVLFVIVEILASLGYLVYLSVFPVKQMSPIVVPPNLVVPPPQTSASLISGFCKAEDVYTELSQAVKNQNKVCELNLIGKMSGIFDPRIFRMTNIKFLRLGTNNLKVLPAELFTLTSLVQLGLGQNGLSAIPADIAKLTNLKILNLTDNDLTTLPDEMSRLKALEQLWLGSNNFSEIERERVGKLLPHTQITY
ncbi:MAG: leucine-rich repeat domain-containing protein [Candidatus Colwellbacteria bacterium]|nr:leucine-rich repeat domain-containing protein [Candidatus Colwellbacteria bacterium]